MRVIKPRIGGGFGAKQTVVTEVYPAIVTWKTGKPAKMIYTREESMIASSPHMERDLRGTEHDQTAIGIQIGTGTESFHHALLHGFDMVSFV